jgi:hypothetical protein
MRLAGARRRACATGAANSRSGSRYGISTTAASHEISSASATTSKIERVYSPVPDFAVAIGRKPAAVISVPVSIGKAVEV